MKKLGANLFILLLVLSLTSIVLAENHTTSVTDRDSKIEKGFICLEEKANNCNDLSVQETALTILATPDNIFDDCVNRLENTRLDNNHWGSGEKAVRDTALAIIALDHAGENTDTEVAWLMTQTRTPTGLIWYLEQDSKVATECNIQYNGKDNRINIGSNKKIDRNAGSCLSRSQSSFWLKIDNDCYGVEFKVSCDEDFITTLLYKNSNSPTIYVLEGTSSAPAAGTTTVQVDSKCFGSNSCDYEGTIWATEALLRTGHTVDEYIPYIISLADSNKRYLPEAFVYMITNYEDYANQLVSIQRLGNFWEAPNTAYDKFYDTSLALIALEGASSSEQVSKAKDWLLFQQKSSGCWGDGVLDTAMALWALEGKSGKTSSGSSTVRCVQAGHFCIPNSDCPSNEDIGNNFFCSGLSTTCCLSENVRTCEEYNGDICDEDEFCSGNERESSDSNSCCTGTCELKLQESVCESYFYSCKSSCSDSEEDAGYSCNSASQICCKTKSTVDAKGAWWIWVLVALIIAVMIAIGYVYRGKLKEMFSKMRKGKKKSDSRGGSRPPGMPPTRPGMPPQGYSIRRAQGRPPMGRPRVMGRPPIRRDKAMSDTFSKLNKMSS
ncbi:MAG: hypothetical protein IH845_01625 [Nanoarchaeota archaeon]|nr:hypothetical protein [Nanoarchaeota archaeon]